MSRLATLALGASLAMGCGTTSVVDKGKVNKALRRVEYTKTEAEKAAIEANRAKVKAEEAKNDVKAAAMLF